LGPEAKLSEYIQNHAETELKPVMEYPAGDASHERIVHWDVKGTPLALAVSYVYKDEPGSVKVVLRVLSVFGEWALCQEDDLIGSPQVHSMEMISPPHDHSKVYVLYSTDDGLDGGYH